MGSATGERFSAAAAVSASRPLPGSSTVRLGDPTTIQKPRGAFDRVTTAASYPDSEKKSPKHPSLQPPGN